ncbi:hypothetical protein [Enterococcus sp.]|uniref:hypothetical protein n=1 Tax=Enterococcus sp. TaxID=35783 RepID=UPI0029112C2E|nr:hypothetical protein [Enterococcus sp.]MDU5335854.1 hypothetical protein [Enterococcus sp.]
MKTCLKRVKQPRRLLLIILSIAAIIALDKFVPSWRLQTVGFLFVIVCDTLFLYFFTDDFLEAGIFTVPSYNFRLKLILDFFLFFALYYSNSTNPPVAATNTGYFPLFSLINMVLLTLLLWR